MFLPISLILLDSSLINRSMYPGTTLKLFSWLSRSSVVWPHFRVKCLLCQRQGSSAPGGLPWPIKRTKSPPMCSTSTVFVPFWPRLLTLMRVERKCQILYANSKNQKQYLRWTLTGAKSAPRYLYRLFAVHFVFGQCFSVMCVYSSLAGSDPEGVG